MLPQRRRFLPINVITMNIIIAIRMVFLWLPFGGVKVQSQHSSIARLDVRGDGSGGWSFLKGEGQTEIAELGLGRSKGQHCQTRCSHYSQHTCDRRRLV